MFAADTKVPVHRSQQEIEELVRAAGAKSFYRGDDQGKAIIGFQIRDRRILFELPLPTAKEFETVVRRGRTIRVPPGQVAQLLEQATRARWRALSLAIKAKLVGVEAGVESFDEAFLAQIVVPHEGRAVRFAAVALAAIGGAYKDGKLPPLLGPGGGT